MGRQTGADARFAVSFRGFGVEGRYLGSFAWQDQHTTGLVTTLLTIPNINFGARTIAAQYGSDFSSREINAFWQVVPRVRIFGGYRRFNIAESFAVDLGGGSNFTIATANRLSGFQAGGALRVFDGADWSPAIAGVYVDVTGRIGRYDSDVSMLTTTANIGGALPSAAASDRVRSTVTELDATVGYRWSPNASVHAGYRYLKLQGLALAPDNIASTNIVTGAASIVRTDVAYSGVFAGLRIGF